MKSVAIVLALTLLSIGVAYANGGVSTFQTEPVAPAPAPVTPQQARA